MLLCDCTNKRYSKFALPNQYLRPLFHCGPSKHGQSAFPLVPISGLAPSSTGEIFCSSILLLATRADPIPQNRGASLLSPSKGHHDLCGLPVSVSDLQRLCESCCHGCQSQYPPSSPLRITNRIITGDQLALLHCVLLPAGFPTDSHHLHLPRDLRIYPRGISSGIWRRCFAQRRCQRQEECRRCRG